MVRSFGKILKQEAVGVAHPDRSLDPAKAVGEYL